MNNAQILISGLSLVVSVAVPTIAYVKANAKIDAKTELHEDRIVHLESEVHGMREHVIETRNDVKWIKETLSKRG